MLGYVLLIHGSIRLYNLRDLNTVSSLVLASYKSLIIMEGDLLNSESDGIFLNLLI